MEINLDKRLDTIDILYQELNIKALNLPTFEELDSVVTAISETLEDLENRISALENNLEIVEMTISLKNRK